MRIITLAFLLSVTFVGCSKCQSYLGRLKPAIPDTLTFTGKTVVFIGNSITLGNVGVSPQSNRWPTVFSTAKGATESNIAISGQVLQNASPCGLPIFNKTTIPVFTNQAALFFSLGINDIGINTPSMTVAGYEATLDSVMDYAINTKGWPSKRIILLTPYWITGYSNYDAYTGCGHTTANVARHEAYVSAVINVAAARRNNIANMYQAMKDSPSNGTFLSGDGLHPNNTGAAFIANYLAGLNFLL